MAYQIEFSKLFVLELWLVPSTKKPSHRYGYGEKRFWLMYFPRVWQWRGWELRNLKSHYVKIVDESILFFSKVSLLKFSLETLYISWVQGVFILEWERNVKSQFFPNRVNWRLGLATWLSRKSKPWANLMVSLDFLSCSTTAGITIQLLCMLH